MKNEAGREIVTTNFKIYKAIADEAHEKMVHLMEMGRWPKSDGSGRWTITHDPNMTSFKHAMISIVFTGMWLDACLHLLLVRKYGKREFEKMKLDKPGKTYEIKLKPGFEAGRQTDRGNGCKTSGLGWGGKNGVCLRPRPCGLYIQNDLRH